MGPDRPPALGTLGADAEHQAEQPDPDAAGEPRSGDGRPRTKEKQRRGPFGFLRELPGLILMAFALALLIKSLLVQAFFIPSQSMEPTLQVGDRVLVNKLIFNLRDIRRGEIIVFENPHAAEPDRGPLSAFWNWVTEGLGVSSDPDKDFIKRVVGLPGETLEIRRGRVFVDGKQIKEPYLHPLKDRSDYGPTKVPEGEYFVMGDNRANSSDSRSALGTIPADKVVGKGFVVLWPPSRLEWLSQDD